MAQPTANTSQEALEAMRRLEWLHIYAQPFEHAEATIMGTRSSLEGLRNAINAALDTGMDQIAKGIVSDGEGFWVEIKIRSMEALEKEPLPYAELVYQANSED